MDQVPQPLDARRLSVALMKPADTSAYLAAWLKLLTRSPAETEAERQSRKAAPAPQPPGSRKTPAKAPRLPCAAFWQPGCSIIPQHKERKP